MSKDERFRDGTQRPSAAESEAAGPEARRQQLLDEAARTAFLAKWPSLTAAEVAERGGAEHLERLLAVSAPSGMRYPVFQFELWAQLEPVVTALRRTGFGGWQIAFWLTEPNAWLEDDARPLELLQSDATAVLTAARREAELPW